MAGDREFKPVPWDPTSRNLPDPADEAGSEVVETLIPWTPFLQHAKLLGGASFPVRLTGELIGTQTWNFGTISTGPGQVIVGVALSKLSAGLSFQAAIKYGGIFPLEIMVEGPDGWGESEVFFLTKSTVLDLKLSALTLADIQAKTVSWTWRFRLAGSEGLFKTFGETTARVYVTWDLAGVPWAMDATGSAVSAEEPRCIRADFLERACSIKQIGLSAEDVATSVARFLRVAPVFVPNPLNLDLFRWRMSQSLNTMPAYLCFEEFFFDSDFPGSNDVEVDKVLVYWNSVSPGADARKVTAIDVAVLLVLTANALGARLQLVIWSGSSAGGKLDVPPGSGKGPGPVPDSGKPPSPSEPPGEDRWFSKQLGIKVVFKYWGKLAIHPVISLGLSDWWFGSTTPQSAKNSIDYKSSSPAMVPTGAKTPITIGYHAVALNADGSKVWDAIYATNSSMSLSSPGMPDPNAAVPVLAFGEKLDYVQTAGKLGYFSRLIDMSAVKIAPQNIGAVNSAGEALNPASLAVAKLKFAGPFQVRDYVTK